MNTPSPSGIAALLRQPFAVFRALCALASLLASPAAKRRFPFAVRAGLCCGIPVMIGWFAGDIQAGLLATIGSFTALYGSDRPYRNRALHLAVIAVALAAVVSLGICVAPHKALAVFVVALIAALATFVSNSLRIGPPGAYMFALACASGTGMAASGADPVRSGLYVLCGGIVSWLAHMAGALINRRGPERAATATAADAVAAFAEASGAPQRIAARHRAARALDDAWTTLVTWQSPHSTQAGRDPVLDALRRQARRLHTIFSQLLTDSAVHDQQQAHRDEFVRLASEARYLGGEARHAAQPFAPAGALSDPRHHRSAWAELKDHIVPWSNPLLLAGRVGVATLIAGGIGVALGLDRAYWGMAAVVVVLNQAYGWPGTFRRACYRVLGTLAGLGLAWAVLALHPQGLWIAAAVGLLQFAIEIWVVLQYAIAAIFITSNALTIAAGGHGFPAITHLFSARALDTAIGCAVALAVFLFTVRRSAHHQLRSEMTRTLAAAQRVLRCLSHGDAATPDAIEARRDLQHQTITLQQVFEADGPALQRQPQLARTLGRTAAATQRLVYRLMNACWELEAAREHDGIEPRPATTATGFADCVLVQEWLEVVKINVSGHAAQPWPDRYPVFLNEEIVELSSAARETT
ncbi:MULTISPECIES: FUSC family protein [unclassified Paraburkholderia]|uniref:FUSC family protein n=1 Tax=unclassified Paraburkholderia TaxID=2615204 RepID=UPI002AB0FA76|nr:MULTISPECIES: FUSC family protein [unclassified Paraburkholderia]